MATLTGTSYGVQLQGWLVAEVRSLTWLWLHGNRECQRSPGDAKRSTPNLAVHLFLVDYRAFGRSQGEPSEGATYLDAAAALAYRRSRTEVDRERIVYFGQSLGAGVAVDLAVRSPAHGLVLEGAFPSTDYVARHQHPFLPLWSVVRPRYDPLAKMGRVGEPSPHAARATPIR